MTPHHTLGTLNVARKLDSYRDKRDPTRTNEPFGAEPMDSSKGVGATTAGRFVVHLHAATRRHYDLRIEVGGTLKSFAVPKGPSLVPLQKHLAVNTEDHPLEYLTFEAVIPAGNYGAGAMIVWDTGTIHYLETDAETGMAKGKLDFLLWGFKLRGRFALVETKQKYNEKQRSWLLIKKPDAYSSNDGDVVVDEPHSVLSGMEVEQLSRAHELADQLRAQALQLGAAAGAPRLDSIIPMRCADGEGRLDNAKCLYELKLDGVRLLAERHGDQVQLRYRTRRNATALFPEIVRALSTLPINRVALDGEVVAFDDRGLPSFAQLAQRIHKQGEHAIAAAMHRKQVQYLVFDILAIDDLDLRKLPLIARKQLLASLLRGKGFVRTVEYAIGDGNALLAFCERFDLEGVIEKRTDSVYVMGPERSRHWYKHKRMHSDDFVVVGYTQGKGGRVAMGALEIASYVDRRLITRGRVGSGLSDSNVAQLLAALEPLTVRTCPAEGELLPAPQGRTFVKPQVVVSVSHAGFTDDGRLRHPVFVRVRPDANANECTAAPEAEREQELVEQAPALQAPKTKVRLTNQRKLFWPGEGITKGDVCEYYAAVAPYLLPYLRDRPVLMVRYPDGIAGKNFYQWNVPVGTPSWVRTEQLHSDEQRRDVTFFRVDDQDTLVYLANLGVIPLHILAGRFSSIERCDFLTIDFDLGEAPLEHAVTLARELFNILDELRLPGFPKTSGQTGLHVLVPMGGAPFEAAVLLANLLGHLVHRRHPQLSTLERMRKKRPNAVYIDTGQTGRSRAIVAPYSVRAVPGATVSTPLTRDEVSAALVPGRHTLFSVPGRLSSSGDPMTGLLQAQPDLTQALTSLKTMLDAR
jgi:bifunctional non-homologous end joining protein LigD